MMPHACHFPIGKTQKTKEKPWTTELIQTIDKMVQYLEAKAIKKGYVLGDLLTRTCFVDGDDEIYQQFDDRVEKILKQNANAQKASIMEQLAEDYYRFDLIGNLANFSADKSVNIKDILYRSITLFVSALGRLQGLNLKSSFAVVEELHNKQIASDFCEIKLCQAVAVACHTRLFHYMSKGRQENVIHSESETWGEEKMMELTQIVGKDSIISSMVTAFTLQQILKYHEVMKISNFDEIWQQYNLPARVMFLILMGLFNDALPLGKLYFETDKSTLNEFDAAALGYLGHAYIGAQQYQTCLTLYKKCKPRLVLQPEHQHFLTKLNYNELYCHYFLGNISHVLDQSEAMLKTDLLKADRSEVLRLNGMSKFRLKKYQDSLSAYRDLFRNIQLENSSWKHDINFAVNMRAVSICLIKAGRKQQGLHLAYEGLNFLKMNNATTENNVMFSQIIEHPNDNYLM